MGKIKLSEDDFHELIAEIQDTIFGRLQTILDRKIFWNKGLRKYFNELIEEALIKAGLEEERQGNEDS